MQTSLDCLPCLARQVVDVGRLAGRDEETTAAIVRAALPTLAELDFEAPPPVVTRQVQRLARALTGDRDPYADLKRRAGQTVAAILPGLAAQVRAAEDPLRAAVQLAIAGNTIDAGANGLQSVERIAAELAAAGGRVLAGDLNGFRRAVADAGNILYLTDNAGEIVVDRLLAEQLAPARLTFAVRGAPVLNDATREDALLAGLDRLGDVIDNGSDAPGTLLPECSAEFRRRFAAADLVIAKGQGNYETLNDQPREIFFLFSVKCAIVARQVGVPVGTQALVRSPAA